MNVKPVLGGWEIPRLTHIETLEKRDLVELSVPGRTGSLFHDMDSNPTRLVLAGSLYGDEARDAFLETLRKTYQKGEPVTFTADIVNATQLQYVVVETLYFQENAANPDETGYHIVLRESPPPPPPADPLGGLDLGLLDEGGNFLDSLSGAMDALDGLGNIPNISDPTPQLRPALEGIQAATAGLGAALTPLTDLFGTGAET